MKKKKMTRIDGNIVEKIEVTTSGRYQFLIIRHFYLLSRLN